MFFGALIHNSNICAASSWLNQRESANGEKAGSSLEITQYIFSCSFYCFFKIEYAHK